MSNFNSPKWLQHVEKSVVNTSVLGAYLFVCLTLKKQANKCLHHFFNISEVGVAGTICKNEKQQLKQSDPIY